MGTAMASALAVHPDECAASRILLIENHPDLLDVLSIALRASGYEVSTACDGSDALALLEEEQWDAIVCDLHLPGLVGEALYQACHASHPDLCSRFLFITGGDRDGVDASFPERSGRPCLHKPFSLNQLVDLAREVAAH